MCHPKFSEYKPHIFKSILQLFMSLMTYFIFLYFGIYFIAIGEPEYAIPLSVLTGLLVVRLFILQHDCSHFSLFKSRKLNDLFGSILSIFTLVPHKYWQKMHLKHHSTTGKIEQRGFGDVYTYTTGEYIRLSLTKKLFYIIYRSPIVILTFGAFWYFLIKMRFEKLGENATEKNQIRFINVILLFIYATAFMVEINMVHLFFFHLSVVYVSGTIGLILFYVQHQFEDAYWRESKDWCKTNAAVDGSSHLVLPILLENFVCRINLHHAHHYNARIPNYYLRDVHEKMLEMGLKPPRVSIFQLPTLFKLKLIDERSNTLVPFDNI